MKFNSSVIETNNETLEVGKNYIYKESFPSEMLLFRLDDIKRGDHPDNGPNWVELIITILKAQYAKDAVDEKITLAFRDGEQLYHGGMWRIYDEGTYQF